jgi:hypothetical protein
MLSPPVTLPSRSQPATPEVCAQPLRLVTGGSSRAGRHMCVFGPQRICLKANSPFNATSLICPRTAGTWITGFLLDPHPDMDHPGLPMVQRFSFFSSSLANSKPAMPDAALQIVRESIYFGSLPFTLILDTRTQSCRSFFHSFRHA